MKPIWLYILCISAALSACQSPKKTQQDSTENALIPFNSKWIYAQLLNDSIFIQANEPSTL